MPPFDLPEAYLELLRAAVIRRSPQPSRPTRAELSRAVAAQERVRQCFRAEIEQLRAGRLKLSGPALATVRGLLLDFQACDVARFLRINTPDTLTLLDEAALDNLLACARQALWLNIPGDFMECGTWRGGACILLRGLLHALGAPRRRVWLADSFAGLPQPDRAKHLLDAVLHEYLREAGGFAVELEEVRQNFRRFHLLDEGVGFLPGWFHETLPSFSGRLALLRLDGDWYESTLTALECLYDQVSPGGYVIIDDYHPVMGAYAAVNDFRARRGITDPLTAVNHQVHFWRKIP